MRCLGLVINMLSVAWVELSAVVGSGVHVFCSQMWVGLFFLRGHKWVLLKVWRVVCVRNGIELKKYNYLRVDRCGSRRLLCSVREINHLECGEGVH